jgi:hypothetical protein
MAKSKRDLLKAQSLYECDFFAWTQQQAELLRHAAARKPTSELDLRNLAEEIESLGKRDRRALASHIARIAEHLLKLHHSRAEEPRLAGKVRSTSTVRRLGGSSRTAQVSKPKWRPYFARATMTAGALPLGHCASSSIPARFPQPAPTASSRF